MSAGFHGEGALGAFDGVEDGRDVLGRGGLDEAVRRDRGLEAGEVAGLEGGKCGSVGVRNGDGWIVLLEICAL